MVFHSLRSKKLIDLIKNGAIGVVPTDTIYGISASALNKEAVERMTVIRRRDESKPFIILIGDFADLLRVGIVVTEPILERLRSLWPAPVSIILPCPDKKIHYLHRGLTSLAIRMPDDSALLAFLKKTGPLVSTSVNRPEGSSPATTVEEVRQYFGDDLDFMVDAGKRAGSPSTILRLDGDHMIVVRQGEYIPPQETQTKESHT
ncbi:MAG: L-threonylcarbamoyladenylate synthase [Patescibacteria group bacterium]